MSEVPKDINKFTNLQELNFYYNKITEIEENTFKSLTNLQKLILSGNKITILKDDTFKSLTNLQELRLHNNKIKIMGRDIFKSLTSLQILHAMQYEEKLQIITQKRLDHIAKMEEIDNEIRKEDEKKKK